MPDLFTVIDDWLVSLLTGWGASGLILDIILSLIGSLVVVGYLLTLALFIIWFERKVVARIQDRIGPNRVGPWGLFQNVADVLKLMTKEIVIPSGADLIPFLLAPVIATATVLMLWAVLPFTRNAIGTDVSIGVLYLAAVSSLGFMSILMAGWSSNNKYALLGAFRAVAMLVSYEVPLILMLLIPVLLTGSMRINAIVEAQSIWYVFSMPLAALIFYIANHAEVARSPFDLLEAESEIVAGYHIEYSGMAFATFYLAEFLHAFTISALTATLFLGGWRGPFVDQVPTLGIVYFFIKSFAVYFVNVWARGTLPRLRIDQIMDFCWKLLVPVSLLLLVLTVIADKTALQFFSGYSVGGTAIEMLPRSAVLFGVNLLVAGIAVVSLAQQGRRDREADLYPETAVD